MNSYHTLVINYKTNFLYSKCINAIVNNQLSNDFNLPLLILNE